MCISYLLCSRKYETNLLVKYFLKTFWDVSLWKQQKRNVPQNQHRFISLQNQNTSYSALYITIFLNEPIINILILKWCLSKYRKCVRKFETNVFICALFWPKISCHYGKEEANWYTRQRNTYFSILLHFHAMYSSVSLLRRFIHITFQRNYLQMKLIW